VVSYVIPTSFRFYRVTSLLFRGRFVMLSHVRCLPYCCLNFRLSLSSVLHRIDIVHTDIKLDNIVLVDDKTVSIIDMNTAGQFIDRVSLFPLIFLKLFNF